MPYISTKANFNVTKEQQLAVKTQLGEAISLLPGKSEKSLMLAFETCPIYFRGEIPEKAVFAEVKLFGKADRTAMNNLTAKICSIYEKELGVPQNMIYIKYEEVEVWGYNGANL